jgi:hypothetical protein
MSTNGTLGYRHTNLTRPVEEKDGRSAKGKRNLHIVVDAQSVGPFDNRRRIVREIRVRPRHTDEGFAGRCREQLRRGLVHSKGNRWRPVERPVCRVRVIMQCGEGSSKMLAWCD